MAILSLCQFKDLTPTLILTIKLNINIFLWFMFRELQSPDEGSECLQLFIPVRIQTDTFVSYAALRFDVLKYSLIAARLLSRSQSECLPEYHFESKLELSTD